MSRNNQLLLFGFLLFLIAFSTEIMENQTTTKLQGGESCTPGSCPEGYGCQPREFPHPAYPGYCVLTATTTTTTTTTGTATTTQTTSQTTTYTTSYVTTYTSGTEVYTVTKTDTKTEVVGGEPFDEAGFGRAVIMVTGLITMMYALLRRR